MRFTTFCLATVLSVGALCPLPAFSSIRIVDNRTEESRKGHRDSIFSAIEYLPDRVIKPGAVEQLRVALEARDPAADAELVIEELNIVDVFLFRANVASTRSAVLSYLFDKKTDWAFLLSNEVPEDVDSVLCALRGTYGGHEVKASAVVPYKLPLTAMMVRSNAKFREAVSVCIGRLVEKMPSVASPPPEQERKTPF